MKNKEFLEEKNTMRLTKDEIVLKLLEDIGKIRTHTDMPYFDAKWIEKHIFTSYVNLYCPNCFENNIKMYDNTFAPCCECGWTGEAINLLSEEEAKNSKRNNLIDKILD